MEAVGEEEGIPEGQEGGPFIVGLEKLPPKVADMIRSSIRFLPPKADDPAPGPAPPQRTPPLTLSPPPPEPSVSPFLLPFPYCDVRISLSSE